MEYFFPHVQLPVSEFHTASMFEPPQMECILYRYVLVVSQSWSYQAWPVQYKESRETDCVSGQQGDLMPFLRAAGDVMAIVYLIVSYAGECLAGENQDTCGKNLFQTFTEGLVLGVSVSKWSVSSAAVSLVARRVREDKQKSIPSPRSGYGC